MVFKRSGGNMKVNRLLLVFCLLDFFGQGFSLTCLKCDDIPLPLLCRTVQHCGPHETCFIEGYVSLSGQFKYRQGCRDTQACRQTYRRRGETLFCGICCQGDLCNTAGCGPQGPSLTDSLICYNCDLQTGPGSCDQITFCGRDEMCQLHPVVMTGVPAGIDLFQTKCISRYDSSCVASPSLIGRRSVTSGCSFCCHGTLCNTRQPGHCHSTGSPSSTLATRATTTRAPLTTSSPQAIPTTLRPGGCWYKNRFYREGQSWLDGCSYICQCLTGQTGLYRCNQTCLNWNLPDVCYMEPPPPGHCCKVPHCPANINIQYPPGYVQL